MLYSQVATFRLHMRLLYSSGSQPGVRVPPRVREKSLGVRQIFFAP
jgi:hypothetical protein